MYTNAKRSQGTKNQLKNSRSSNEKSRENSEGPIGSMLKK
jgi:hypothetical protein